MSMLNTLAPGEFIEFTRLKNLLKATDGNLGAHLSTLGTTGYLRIEKDFKDKKPRTRVALTREGRRAFARHVAFLRGIIEGSGE